MKIGILGATGMLGHHCAIAALARGHQVVVLHRATTDLSKIDDIAVDNPDVILREVDTLSQASMIDAFQGLDALVHAAAYYPTKPRPWHEDVALATRDMSNFYAACQRAKVARILYVGGSIALDRNPLNEPGHEGLSYEHQPDNNNPYLQVKWLMDDMALEQAKAGMDVVIGIPAMTIGEYDYGPTTGQFITRMANDQMPAFVDGKRNMVYAGDAGRGLILALEKGQSGERYLITGENLSMSELLQKITTLVGKPLPKAIPLLIARLVSAVQHFKYRWLRGEEPALSKTAIAIMSYGQFLSGDKAAEQLGYYPEVSADEAIVRATQWFKSEGYIK